MDSIRNLQALLKAYEAGNYNAAPSTLVQGAALQHEDLSPLMHNVTYTTKSLKLQQMLKAESCKSLLWQFNRELSYGILGGAAQLEGAVGQEETADTVRITVPMCFYSHTRRVTLPANLVDSFDGKKADDRAAEHAAKLIAGDIEFDLFRGLDDFSNGGVFDGNPLDVPRLPNMMGLQCQIRQSDDQVSTAHDLMFEAFGSGDSVVIAAGSTLTQDNIEDAAVRSAMNHGEADQLIIDPKVLSAYNKISFGKERILLAGSPQDATSADLRKQWVSGGTVSLQASRFLSGRTGPDRSRLNGPSTPGTVTSALSGSADGTPFLIGEVYTYRVTQVNEIGESVLSASTAETIAVDGETVTVTITPSASVARYFRVYRTAAGGSTYKFIGAVKNSGASTTDFVDLGNKQPGFVTGVLVQGDTMELRELAPYSRTKLAQTDLSSPEAHYRFLTLAVTQPRKNCLIDNLRG